MRVGGEPQSSSVGSDSPVSAPDPWPLQHSALGSDVLLRCAVPAGAAGVEWRVNGTSVATALDVLVATEDGLVLPNASLAQEGDYSCHHPASGEALRRIRLRLGCE